MSARRILIAGGLGVVLFGVGSVALIWRLQGGDRTRAGPEPLEESAPAASHSNAGSFAAPPAAPASAIEAPSGGGAPPLAGPPVAPGRISSRRHRGATGRPELAVGSPEALGTQLLAGLSGLRAQIGECSRISVNGNARAEAQEAAPLLRALAAQSGLDRGPLTDEAARILRDMERAARLSAIRRTLLLDVETLDGSMRILDVSPDGNASSDDVVTCARQELRGKVIPAPAARAGSRFPMALPLGPPGEPGEAERAARELAGND